MVIPIRRLLRLRLVTQALLQPLAPLASTCSRAAADAVKTGGCEKNRVGPERKPAQHGEQKQLQLAVRHRRCRLYLRYYLVPEPRGEDHAALLHCHCDFDAAHPASFAFRTRRKSE